MSAITFQLWVVWHLPLKNNNNLSHFTEYLLCNRGVGHSLNYWSLITYIHRENKWLWPLKKKKKKCNKDSQDSHRIVAAITHVLGRAAGSLRMVTAA